MSTRSSIDSGRTAVGNPEADASVPASLTPPPRVWDSLPN
jgi:hypothetical protein